MKLAEMLLKNDEILLLKLAIGKHIQKVGCVIWVLDGEDSIGEIDNIQLTMDDGTVLLFSASTDGRSFVISSDVWQDPFAVLIEEETQAWLDNAGRPKLLDFSTFNHFRFVTGKPVSAIRLVVDQSIEGKTVLCGVQFDIGDQVMTIYTLVETLYVLWGESPPVPSHMTITEI